MCPVSSTEEALACVGLRIDIALFVDEPPAEHGWAYVMEAYETFGQHIYDMHM